MRTKDILRFASIAALLLAGSCAAPTNDGVGFVTDPAANHPIAVEPSYHTIKLPFSPADAGLMPEDAAHFSVFVEEYLNSGNGAISTGPRSVARWLEERGSRPLDEFVELIPFKETRLYVKSVLGDYLTYRAIWKATTDPLPSVTSSTKVTAARVGPVAVQMP